MFDVYVERKSVGLGYDFASRPEIYGWDLSLYLGWIHLIISWVGVS